MPFDWVKNFDYFVFNLCCLRHNKAGLRNVSIRTTLYLKFILFTTNKSRKSNLRNEFNSSPSYTHMT